MSRTPQCFGDTDEYSPISGICKKCPYRHDCREECDSQVNKGAASYGSTRTSRKKKKTDGEIAPLSAGKALMSVGLSPYNHSRPLAPQFMRYLGLSVARITLEEGIQLIDSAREHYAEENMREFDALDTVIIGGDSDGDD